MHETNPTSDASRAAARQAVLDDDTGKAETMYVRLLESAPGDAEALNYLAVQAASRGDLQEASKLLGRASRANPSDAGTWRNLGVCALALGDNVRAVTALEHSAALDPDDASGHLQRGCALERCGRSSDATAAYLRALAEARRRGYWTSDDTTPPSIRGLVQHAVRQVRTGKRELLASLIDPLTARHGKHAMRRVARMAGNFVGDAADRPRDSRQRPTFLYFPGLPTTPYLDRRLFGWYEQLEAATEGIRAEASALLDGGVQFVPFLGDPGPNRGSSYLTSSCQRQPRWDAHFFWRHGIRYDDNCGKAPFTALQLEGLPLGKVPKHGPECLFSILGPHSEIQRHTGVTNTRIVTHLPLIVPPGCAIRVAGQVHEWKPGRCVSFDDTFEHEAWNRSGDIRVVLLFDTWNPHLEEAERDAISQLVTAIGEFNAKAWEPPATAGIQSHA